ncbi:MAG: twin-arginine translocation signal domain-containing protein [Steroidobacteraceae bacterium]
MSVDRRDFMRGSIAGAAVAAQVINLAAQAAAANEKLIRSVPVAHAQRDGREVV